jgi:hypothetical protein
LFGTPNGLLVCDTQFIDGTWRAVYETPSGRQYVVDDKGAPVNGVLFIPREDQRFAFFAPPDLPDG